MEPPGPAEPHDLKDLRVEVLRRAASLYTGLAYPDAPPPEAVRRRLEWDESLDAESLLGRSPFERAGKSKTTGAPIYALRLGNARYPHMKLQVQPWPNAAGYMLSVNTHDQAPTIDPGSGDMAAFRALQAENQRLKELIEQAWDDAGLPTFLRYLRDYIEQRTGEAPKAGPGPS